MKAQSKDYVRDSQIRVIVQPLLMMLASDLGGEGSIVQVLKGLLSGLAADAVAAASYGAGNCLNLLGQLQADLTGLDLVGLSIRQADLREVSLAGVNLTRTNLATSVFAESIGDIYTVAISPDDQLVASSGSDGKISVWYFDSGQNLLNVKAHEGYIMGLAFLPDRNKLISAGFDGNIKIWDVYSGVCTTSWQSSTSIYRITLNPEGLILACASECGAVLLWDVKTGKLLRKLLGHSASVMTVAFHPQMNMLASGSYDSKVRI